MWQFGFKSLGVLCSGEDRLLVLVAFIANYGSSALQPDFLLLWSILLQCLFQCDTPSFHFPFSVCDFDTFCSLLILFFFSCVLINLCFFSNKCVHSCSLAGIVLANKTFILFSYYLLQPQLQLFISHLFDMKLLCVNSFVVRIAELQGRTTSVKYPLR